MMVKPVSATEIRTRMGLQNATKFREKYLNPLIGIGVIKMTIPDKPNSRLQQYMLTEVGKGLLK